uniref:Glycogen debranching enzyme GlgX n=1 Tax=Desulfobacca acetoxidans TaxID=60893 RepID=A0A7V4LDV4_9BACT
MSVAVNPGRSFPLGATVYPEGVNFSVFAKGATGVELLLFRDADSPRPDQVIALNPRLNKTYHYWHVFVPGLKAGQIYGYRAAGPWAPERGARFDAEKVLLDPYGRAVAVPPSYSRDLASQPGENTAAAMKSVVADLGRYDWEGDQPLQRPFAQTIIYELHVGGFTKHPSSGVAKEKRGTFAGLIEKIPYLTDLGVTAVELLPIFQFDAQDSPPGLVNYWGYSPVSFFALHQGYGSRQGPLAVLDEFRDLVKALHRAGIEIFLDVVFNHTAEGNHLGPTLSFRGLANEVYYLLEPDRSLYADYSGCGNTLNANQSVVRRLMVDSLRYWVEEMHVDGFRFDLASILSRDEKGQPLENPPVLWDIESEPVLAGTKLIAEAWDAAGLYQVGRFVGDTWKEWNGKFRDDIRAFLRGDPDTVSSLAHRLLASPDLYEHKKREVEQSINFVTCHDGFTLNDLVSYNHKHNEANGEDNRDGSDYNLSWNCGVEGPTDDPEVESLRNRQVKNFLALTLLSFGTPMLLMGDEVRRSQQGNNNAYCQDNELSWFDWTLVHRHRDVHRFVKELIRLRLHFDKASLEYDLTLTQFLAQAKIDWHGVTLHEPDWGPESHSLAATAVSLTGARVFHFICNAYWEALSFELPDLPDGADGGWRRLLDTALPAPLDICEDTEAVLWEESTYLAQPRSVVFLFANIGQGLKKATRQESKPDERN